MVRALMVRVLVWLLGRLTPTEPVPLAGVIDLAAERARRRPPPPPSAA
jgi:hypothetical protein